MNRYISEEVVASVNSFISMCFDFNSLVDNCSYALQADMGFNNVGDVVHKHWAHWFVGDECADKASDILIRNNARPVRLATPAHIENYASVFEVFKAIVKALEDLRAKALEVVELCDYDVVNRPVGIEFEEIAINIVNKLRETNTLADTIRKYNIDEKEYKLEKDIYKLVKE